MRKRPPAPTDACRGNRRSRLHRPLRWYASAYGTSSISLRYFNAAGATERQGERHEPETHLIPLVLAAAAGRRPHVTIFGADYPTPDGTCVRDYIHVEDLARAHVLALSALEEPGVCRSYNLGCRGDGYSVREVIDTAVRVTSRRIPVKVAERRSGDPAVLVASSERIRRDVGWRPGHQQLDVVISSAWQWLQWRGVAER
jgi:UDP-glucose 4-epimerase